MSALMSLLTSYPRFVDLEIPLRAADRWIHGGQPYLVRIRLEIALVAALLIATYTLQGLWAGIAVAVVGLLGSERYPVFREFQEADAS